MALTNFQIEELAKRMKIPLVFCGFKSDLKNIEKLQYNKSYIVNLEDEFDNEGNPNDGSHWVCFQVNKYPNGRVEPFYFDSYGVGSPKEVEEFTGMTMPYQKKDLQSIVAEVCGWYCLALLHFVNSSPYRSGHLYTDCENFIELFDDLNTSNDHLKNEFILKQFFQSEDKTKRAPIEVGHGTSDWYSNRGKK
jgi:hypothetical protein